MIDDYELIPLFNVANMTIVSALLQDISPFSPLAELERRRIRLLEMIEPAALNYAKTKRAKKEVNGHWSTIVSNSIAAHIITGWIANHASLNP